MNRASARVIVGAAGIVAGAASVNAAEVLVSQNIATSTTWTSGNTYNLTKQIYVLPGATLTIEPGTIVASTPSANGGGSLAVTRGARIFVNGTFANPVIMTSKNDNFTTWREAANEWGNLTIMGRAFISNSFVAGNTATCNANNVSPMEGLTPDFVGDPNTLYGGGDDDDDSGCISFLSLRYGGRVLGLANELNGLSLGGIGRGTDIQYVEVMNNVDDGIEIWGGTVNLKYISIWNVGDDSFDIDQGWRGKAQFGLIVQGYSLDAAQGSGVGDNNFETDGAENSDAQPVTTANIYNFTVIGQPVPGAGDHGTAWRDNARVQYHNCIFMDLGDRLVSFDNVDGDGSQGYGFNGTLSWPATWTTNYNVYSTVNACPNPAMFYQAQTSGKLASITDSVFFRNLSPSAYTEAQARGVVPGTPEYIASNNNVLIPGFEEVNQPIVSITRAAPVTKGGTTQLRVIGLDPRAKNQATTSVAAAPNDGFFTPAMYRGGFSSTSNWVCGWTAAAAYGFIASPPGGCVTPPGTPCETPKTVVGDLNGDGIVDGADVGLLLGSWGACAGCPADLDGNGTVDGSDLGLLLGNWG
ncbi:MAG: hypothetical protein KDA22_08355 [Phycisphaerales bacterium]|nr:hypothetical protein [Phycisphaerales bacterium]